MAVYSQIVSCGKFVPQQTVSNQKLSEICNTTDDWIRTRTGILERRYAPVNIGTSDMGVEAARCALDRAELDPVDVQLILASTQTPDFYFPGIGVQLQDKLGCRQIPAIDIRGQCSGFSWALSCADAYIRSGMYANVLLVCSDLHSRFLDYSDQGRAISVLLADGAGAVVMKQVSERALEYRDLSLSAVYGHVLGSDGTGIGSLVMQKPGMREGQSYFASNNDGIVNKGDYHPDFDGPKLFRNAIEQMSGAVKRLLNNYNLSVNDVDMFIPHQANRRIVDGIAKKCNINGERIFSNIEKYRNTGSASIPIALEEALESKMISRGSLIVTVAFGSGYTWGANLFRL